MHTLKPILFNTPMTQAILEGRKTQTRRIVPFGIALDLEIETDGSVIGVLDRENGTVRSIMDFAKYRPGDILYVRETFSLVHVIPRRFIYAADVRAGIGEGIGLPIRWRPSIHMPKEAARIFLRVKKVGVERLQSISAEDCIAEGCDPEMLEVGEEFIRGYFSGIWDDTIRKNDLSKYGWDANPWVWAFAFERIDKKEVEKWLVA